ncbi:hypothetical protein M9H77_21044 [Catharanthus roseus]|uniref:Uncharacterized protein n=1 Tax=Catharanthus roseus TaxID=4058 RepID=A0ACC0ALW9_CATRO|nr:hypothetical protein M9H77_21044 [Catharanthus roseus]
MAPFAKQFSFVLLLVLLFTSNIHVEARDGKFFFVSLQHSHHKKSHEKSTSLETPTPAPVAGGDFEFAPVPASRESGDDFAPAPAPSRGDIEFAPTPIEGGSGNIGYAPVPAPAPEGFESDNPYGLYGNDNEENEFLDQEFNGEKLTEYANGEKYNNNNNNGYVNNNNNGYSSNLYDNMGWSNSNYGNKGYNNNRYESDEKQGMSDTRSLEKGKYYYTPNQDKYNNYENDGYDESESVMRGSNNEGYYGERSKYEFDSIDEYERQQGYISP